MSQTIFGSGDPRGYPDIHGASDGRLIRYDITSRFSIPERQLLISGLMELMNNRSDSSVRGFGLTGLDLIRRDAGSAANWQGTDHLFADDVVAEIAYLISQVKDDDVVVSSLNHLGEQMADMIRTGGVCPSGRLNRAHQIYMVIRDYIDGKHLPPSTSTP